MEDPSFRRTPIYSPTSAAAATVGSTSTQIFGQANSLIPVVLGVNAAGQPIGFGFTDGIQRNRMPDFVGVLRYDQPWGSAQISGRRARAEHRQRDRPGRLPRRQQRRPGSHGRQRRRPRTTSEYGWAVQGGLKVNAPFIARATPSTSRRLCRGRADVHRQRLVQRLLRDQPDLDPGRVVQPELLRRDDQPVHQPPRALDKLLGCRFVPALLGPRVALGRVRLLR